MLVAATAACGRGQITGGAPDAVVGPDADPRFAAAEAAFNDNVLPLLNSYCLACHSSPGGAIGFLVPDPTVHGQIINWNGPGGALLDFENPRGSLILNKGIHAGGGGPAWDGGQFDTVLAWIELEAVARGYDVPPPTTAPFPPVMGQNEIPLDQFGMPGSTITFLYEPLTAGAYISDLRLNASVGGAHIVHPRFIIAVGGMNTPEPVDRFSDVDLSVEEGMSAFIGGGTLVLLDLPQDAELRIAFEVAERLDQMPVADAGPVGGCLAVAEFTANAQPTLQNSCAAPCHGGANPEAVNATDMREMPNLAVENQSVACGHVLLRVSLPDPDNSGIFYSGDPAQPTAHPFKFPDAPSFDAFRAALRVWIDAENAARQ